MVPVLFSPRTSFPLANDRVAHDFFFRGRNFSHLHSVQCSYFLRHSFPQWKNFSWSHSQRTALSIFTRPPKNLNSCRNNLNQKPYWRITGKTLIALVTRSFNKSAGFTLHFHPQELLDWRDWSELLVIQHGLQRGCPMVRIENLCSLPPLSPPSLPSRAQEMGEVGRGLR